MTDPSRTHMATAHTATRPAHPSKTARPRRLPGRPRDTALESAVLAATVELLLEMDTKDVTISAITERSGVSRAALYRRWSSREELLAAALDSVRSDVALLPTGNILDSILSSYGQSVEQSRGRVGSLVKKRVALGLENERVRVLSWERHVSRRREPIAAQIRAAIEAGEIDAGVNIAAMIDLINGLYYYQFVVRGPEDPAAIAGRVEDAMRLVWEGVRKRP